MKTDFKKNRKRNRFVYKSTLIMENNASQLISDEDLKKAPSIYANGFQLQFTPTDICINLVHNDICIQRLSVSLMTAKNLSFKIKMLTDAIESYGNITIPVWDELAPKLQALTIPTKNNDDVKLP